MEIPLRIYGLGLSLAIILAIGGACSADRLAAKPVRTLFDFEKTSELDHLHWVCGTFMEQDKQHATSGQYSLRVEMYPSAEYPGFKAGFTKGWQGYKKLLVDLYHPGLNEMTIAYRIDDRDDNPSFADRANGRIVLQPGANIFTLDLENLKTSGTDRKLDLEGITGLYLFVHRPPQPVVLYLDNMRLVRE
ncbi:MAG: hypothetical protein KKC76_12360 [Proteobacteria bacterium]|nr:hypothetical protein [Pseudomonadota bacterium]MBU4295333.1 hypothetical protein [Pseudomonadota bacterium]MCG2748189.1 hypothetical protein [Desulfobulbaceae bacterium]